LITDQDILQALHQSDNNKTLAAKLLNIPRTTFHSKYSKILREKGEVVPDEPRMLLIDSEWLPNRGVFWDTGKQYVGYKQITQERSMMMFQYGTMEVNKEYVISIGDKKDWQKNPYDDEYVVRAAHAILIQYDIYVGHNLKGFDVKMFNSRAILYGLPPLPNPILIDTLSEYKAIGRFNSFGLDYLSKLFGSKGKLHTTLQNYIDISNGCAKTLKEYTKYARKDIKDLRLILKPLLPYIKRLPNKNIFSPGGEGCPKCGGEVRKKGFKYTSTGQYQKYQCKTSSCGAWSASGKRIKGADIRV